MKTHFEITRLTIPLFSLAFFTTRAEAQHPILGTTDIKGYLMEAPGLAPTLTEAATRAYGINLLQPDPTSLDNFYQDYEDKVNQRIAVYQDYAQQKIQLRLAQVPEDAYQAQAMKDINGNPIIANMGGYEQIRQMSEEERRAAAIKATAEFTANPAGGLNTPSAGMTALYQKVASDPEYARKFQKMSEAEKEAELRKYMANDQVVAKTSAQMEAQRRKVEAGKQQADLVRNAQEIQLEMSALQQKLSLVTQQYAQRIGEIDQEGQTHEAIDGTFEPRFQAIPLVEMGEYGHGQDPAQVKALRLEAAQLHRERAQAELVQYTQVWNELSQGYQQIVTEYLDFLNQNQQKIYGGVSPEDMMHGLNTELPLLEFEAALVGLALDLCQQAKELTKETATWEQQYQEISLGTSSK